MAFTICRIVKIFCTLLKYGHKKRDGREERPRGTKKIYVFGWNACLVIKKIVVLMASSIHLISIIFCISQASSFNYIYNQLSARFSERPRYFSGELIPNRLFRVFRRDCLEKYHIWNKESTQIKGTEPLGRSLGKCPGMQVKISKICSITIFKSISKTLPYCELPYHRFSLNRSPYLNYHIFIW